MIPVVIIGALLVLMARGRVQALRGNGNWRIYRLPGSRDKWHVDNGDGTPVVNIHSYVCKVPSRSVDRGDGVPRAWIEIDAQTSVMQLNGDQAQWVPYTPECKGPIGYNPEAMKTAPAWIKNIVRDAENA